MHATANDTSNALDRFMDSMSLGIKPNVYLYNTVISELAKAHKAEGTDPLGHQTSDNIEGTSIVNTATTTA